MVYTKKTWVNGGAPAISAANLQTIDDQVDSNEQAISNYLAEGVPTYGFSWDMSSDTYARTGALVGYSLGTSPGNIVLPIHAQMRGCLLNDAGEVQYYLDASDWSLKEDGTASDLTGGDGQVKVQVPKFYRKHTLIGNVFSRSISQVKLPGYEVHPAFVKNGVEVDYRYAAAYPAVLYDVSASIYANGLYLTAKSVTFTAATSTISRTAESNPFTLLEVGDKIVVSGTVSNNGTFTVATTGTQSITVSEALVDETAAATIIETEKDWTATTGDKLCSISGKSPINWGTRANFRAAAANRGTGWRQDEFYLESALQELFLIEYGSFNSQSVIGNGLTDWSSGVWSGYNDYNPINKTGYGNSVGNGTISVSNGDGIAGSYMKWRGIEDWYGGIWTWYDGANVNSNAFYVTNDDSNFADDTATGYTLLGTLINANGWQDTLLDTPDGFLPITVGASSSTKITDYYYQLTGWRVVLLGGNANYGADAGAFYLNANNASSNLARSIGGRLAF